MVALAGLLLALLGLSGAVQGSRRSVRAAARLAAWLVLPLVLPLLPPPAAAAPAVLVETFVELPPSSAGKVFLLQVLGEDRLVAGARLRVEAPGLYRLQLLRENLLVDSDDWDSRLSQETLRLRGAVCRSVEGGECRDPQLRGESSSEVVRTPGDRLVRLTPAIVLR